MKPINPRCTLFTAGVLLVLLLLPTALLAHGTGHRILEDEAALTVEFFYADGEPMRYAEVLIFNPQDPKIEYQNGRTDLHGRFAFLPDTPGIWRITADDGMGHLAQATLDVASPNPAVAPEEAHPKKGVVFQGSAPSRLTGMIAGLSILLNIVLLVLWWKGRKPR